MDAKPSDDSANLVPALVDLLRSGLALDEPLPDDSGPDEPELDEQGSVQLAVQAASGLDVVGARIGVPAAVHAVVGVPGRAERPTPPR